MTARNRREGGDGRRPADRICIRDLSLRCVIGVFPGERRARQDVIISIALGCDARPAARSDRITDAVDYKAIKKKVIQLVEGSGFHLIETLADRIASVCLEDPKVRSATVTVDKHGALRFARSVGVEITRSRPE